MRLKKRLIIIATISAVTLCSFTATAQGYYRQQSQRYQQRNYENVSSGASIFHYKGFLETGFSAGIGSNRANEFEALTTHGVTLGDILFVGVGSGVNVYFPEGTNAFEYNRPGFNGSDGTAMMVPIFLDGRISGTGKISGYFDVKAGVSILASSNMIVNEDYFDNGNVCYYFSTSAGVRFAIGHRSAFSLGVVYNLVGQGDYQYGYNYGYDYYEEPYYVSGPSLSNIGVRATLEW